MARQVCVHNCMRNGLAHCAAARACVWEGREVEVAADGGFAGHLMRRADEGLVLAMDGG